MKRYETLWNVMTRYETLWNVMKRYETLWNVMKRYETLWNVMKRYETWIQFSACNWDTMWRHVTKDIIAVQPLWRVWANSWAVVSRSFSEVVHATKSCQTCRESERSVFQLLWLRQCEEDEQYRVFKQNSTTNTATTTATLQIHVRTPSALPGACKNSFFSSGSIDEAGQCHLQLFCW